jgi:hypothetical protein
MSNQSVLNLIPENTSLMQTARYTFAFPTLPFLTYFMQTTTIPGVSTGAIKVENPFSATYRHGDKLVFEPLAVTALLDEDMRVWEETFNWLKALTFPNKFEEYQRFKNPNGSLYHDAILTVNTNSNIPNIRYKFTHCHPVVLSNVQLNTTLNADDYVMTAEITFRYDQFYMERLTF